MKLASRYGKVQMRQLGIVPSSHPLAQRATAVMHSCAESYFHCRSNFGLVTSDRKSFSFGLLSFFHPLVRQQSTLVAPRGPTAYRLLRCALWRWGKMFPVQAPTRWLSGIKRRHGNPLHP